MRHFFMIITFMLFSMSVFAEAAFELSPRFGEGMILQREQTNLISGKTVPNEKITIFINQKEYTELSDSNGKWNVRIDALPVGGPYTLIVKGELSDKTIELSNILSGDVWICAGQSNMEWSMEKFSDNKDYISQASNENIRLLTVEITASLKPQEIPIIRGGWQKVNSETISKFFSTGYFFGKKLHEETGVPVGLISINLGGSMIETWIDESTLTSSPLSSYKYNHKNIVSSSFKKVYQQWFSGLFNGMIAPMKGLSLKGVIWYQGESNVPDQEWFGNGLSLLMDSWCKHFEHPNLPFYIVQIAPYNYGINNNKASRLMEIQYQYSKQNSNATTVVICDIGDYKNIHPGQKWIVGERLANAALANLYGKSKELAQYPEFVSLSKEDNSLLIKFKNCEKGLISPEKVIYGFEIADQDGFYKPADVKIEGSNIRITSISVKNPVYVRYGWVLENQLKIYNEYNLPLVPFRTDSFLIH